MAWDQVSDQYIWDPVQVGERLFALWPPNEVTPSPSIRMGDVIEVTGWPALGNDDPIYTTIHSASGTTAVNGENIYCGGLARYDNNLIGLFSYAGTGTASGAVYVRQYTLTSDTWSTVGNVIDYDSMPSGWQAIFTTPSDFPSGLQAVYNPSAANHTPRVNHALWQLRYSQNTIYVFRGDPGGSFTAGRSFIFRSTDDFANDYGDLWDEGGTFGDYSLTDYGGGANTGGWDSNTEYYWCIHDLWEDEIGDLYIMMAPSYDGKHDVVDRWNGYMSPSSAELDTFHLDYYHVWDDNGAGTFTKDEDTHSGGKQVTSFNLPLSETWSPRHYISRFYNRPGGLTALYATTNDCDTSGDPDDCHIVISENNGDGWQDVSGVPSPSGSFAGKGLHQLGNYVTDIYYIPEAHRYYMRVQEELFRASGSAPRLFESTYSEFDFEDFPFGNNADPDDVTSRLFYWSSGIYVTGYEDNFSTQGVWRHSNNFIITGTASEPEPEVGATGSGYLTISLSQGAETDTGALWMTLYNAGDQRLELKQYDGINLTLTATALLGPTTESEVLNRNGRIAYVYAATDDQAWVYGRMEGPANLTGTVHLMETTTGPTGTYSDLSPAWNPGDILGALHVSSDQTGADDRVFNLIRNQTGSVPEYWSGLNTPVKVADLPFPTGSLVKHGAIHRSRSGLIGIGNDRDAEAANRVVVYANNQFNDVTYDLPSGTISVLRFF